MKFVHIADLHLDRPFVSLKGNKELSKRRKIEQKYVFKKVIDYILENRIEVLLISGDLFEQKFVTEDSIQYLIACFKNIKDTKVYITPGNHDPLISTSPYLRYEWPENVYIFGAEIGKYQVGNVNIYGFGFDDYYMEKNNLSSLELDKTKTNILITHATLNGATKKYNDINQSELKEFDYVALRTHTLEKGGR